MTNSRTNILLIMQDQLRYDVASGAQGCSLPILEQLRADGAWFTKHYTPLGICSPARASLFTGTFPHTNGVMNNMNGTEAFLTELPAEYPTAAQFLKDAGYRTGYVGKWHLGKDSLPATRGFTDAPSGDADYMGAERFQPYWSRFGVNPRVAGGDTSWVGEISPDAVVTSQRPPGSRFAARFHRIPLPVLSFEPVDEYLCPAVAVTEQTIEMIEHYARIGNPFFLVCSFIEPHWPNVLPEPWASMYDPSDVEPWESFDRPLSSPLTPRTLAAGLEHFGVEGWTWDDWAPIVASYLGACSFIDALIGRILDRLESLGLAESTVVVATADHGDMTGSHGGQFNKGPIMCDEVYKVPLVVRGPGVKAGSEADGLSSHVDMLATMLEIADLEPPKATQGSSLWPWLRGEPPRDWRRSLMCEFHGDEYGLYSQRMLRRDNWKLVYNPNDVRELYELNADPSELVNLAYESEHQNLLRDLEADLLEWMHDTEDPLRLWAINVLG